MDELVNKMESRKEIRRKQIEDRAKREKERGERDKVCKNRSPTGIRLKNRSVTCCEEEKQRREVADIQKKAEDEEKKKDALAAMSMNYGG